MKVIRATVLIALCAMIGLAQAPTGIRGFVYDHDNNYAGNKKDTIIVVETSDQAYVGHYYNPGNSNWITNDTYGLYTGNWAILGKVNEGDVAYWSSVYCHDWETGQLIDQDIHCTSTIRPQIQWSK